MRWVMLLLCTGTATLVAASCDDGGDGDADADVDGDVDGDVDADTDTDSDVDADADGDVDADTDTDADVDTDVDADGACTSDSMCTAGEEWCEGGVCVPCDNGGLACDIDCISDWSTYQRNGCFPCACAPPNECTADADCGEGGHCYAGAMCWDWCEGDVSCCMGNVCSPAGCTEPPPVGCFVRGCPVGLECSMESGCASSGATCTDAGWASTPDCNGGVCLGGA